MGPRTLFDKSFLQSLSLDEAVLFDQFFYAVIAPLFFVETLADLEKALRNGRTPEQEVGIIAMKTPQLHGAPIAMHQSLAVHNLLGWDLPMDGRMPMAGGRPVMVNGKRGVNYDHSPEAKAFARWQKGQFLEVEREQAKIWRSAIASLDLPAVAKQMQRLGISPQSCKSLADAHTLAETFISERTEHFNRMKLALVMLSFPDHLERQLFDRWQSGGYPPISEFAPYAAFVAKVELFFQIALAASLISPDRATNRVDISYLMYVPFSDIFVSSDKLHRACASLFLRPDQKFVWGEDLKADLKYLDSHYKALPSEELEKGLLSFARTPPQDSTGLVSQLWDARSKAWRTEKPIDPSVVDRGENRELLRQYQEMARAPTANVDPSEFNLEELDALTIERQWSKKRGTYWQLSKDFKDADGEKPQ